MMPRPQRNIARTIYLSVTALLLLLPPPPLLLLPPAPLLLF